MSDQYTPLEQQVIEYANDQLGYYIEEILEKQKELGRGVVFIDLDNDLVAFSIIPAVAECLNIESNKEGWNQIKELVANYNPEKELIILGVKDREGGYTIVCVKAEINLVSEESE